MEKENKEKLLDHNYDGIQELDNPLPRWWLATFYLCIVFAVGYFAYYQYMGGPTLKQELAEDLKLHGTQAPQPQAAASAVDFQALEHDNDKIAAGKIIFAARCVACHGDKGQGVIGPNLTDKFWIHGDGKIDSILKVVREGVAEKGMPPWNVILKEDETLAVAAFVHSIKDSHPANPKPPQGNEIED